MKNVISIIVLFSCGIVLADGQKKITHKSPRKNVRQSILVHSGRPSVYITFVKRESIDGSSYVFYRLTNNLSWPIVLDMSDPGGKRFGDATLYYVVEDSKTGEQKTGRLYCHVCSTNNLGSGRSIQFSVPTEEIELGNVLRIRYEFESESDVSSFEGSDTLHTVAYYLDRLPQPSKLVN